MHVDVDKLYLGEYQFTIELDTGSETGGNQLTVWCAKKVAIETVSLKKFGLEDLMRALVEPYRTLLAGQLVDEQSRLHESFEAKISEIRVPFMQEDGTELPLSSQARRQIRSVQHQKKQAQRQMERDFLKRELVELDRQWFNQEILEKASRVFGEGRFLRSFYFGEANEKYIHNFCRKFALNASYREEVLAGRARWFKRNALFYRNISHVAQMEQRVGEKSASSYDAWLYHLFLWIDRHYENILALPEYQRLQSLDGSDEPGEDEGRHHQDKGIHLAVEVFQQIPGIRVVAACQGISGTVDYLGRNLLPLSAHEARAHILLEILEEEVEKRIHVCLPIFGPITCEQWGREKIRLKSIDIEHNAVFCEEVLRMGRRMVEGG